MAKSKSETNLHTSPLQKHLILRPRIDEIMDKAAECRLVCVVAGAGYGKTTAVQNYINKQKDAAVRWLQLTESDNIGSHYWENFTHAVSLDNPHLAKDLHDLGFPETLLRFKQFADILKREEHHFKKTFLVLDDFHLINSKKALTFAQRCAHLRILGSCVIIISRAEPDINIMALLSKSDATIITQDDLSFTGEEVMNFFALQNLSCTSGKAEKLVKCTNGWPLAVNLLSLVTKKTHANLDIAIKLTTNNINRLFESEAWKELPETIQKTLVKLSLAPELPLPLSNRIFGDEEVTKFLPELASFLSYDNIYNNHRIHPLYLSFLKEKQSILTKKEKYRTYQKAAEWCLENSFFASAVRYYAKSYEYDKILDVFRSYSIKVPHEAYRYFLEILESAKLEDEQKENPQLSKLKALSIPFLLIGIREYDRAEKYILEVLAELENTDPIYKTDVIVNLYNALAHITKYTCITTHEHKTSMYFEKALKLSEQSGVIIEDRGIFSLPDIRSFACLIGADADYAELERFTQVAQELTKYSSEHALNRFHGFDDLVACEIAFFKNNLEESAQIAHRAVMSAHDNSHYGIEIMLKQYLLRIAIHKGDYLLSKEILKQISACIENAGKLESRLLYDLITGSFYIHIGATKLVAPWIISESDKAESADFRIPMRELIISVRYYLEMKEYSVALSILSNSYPRLPHEQFLFSELILAILLSIAQLMTGDVSSAVKSFEKAYRLSSNGLYEMPFIEMGKTFHNMAVALADDKSNEIPDKWLVLMARKAKIYAKNTSIIEAAFKHENAIENKISLSPRESEVLRDMCKGFSRSEIAENRYLSVNTVKKILQSLYIKLDANNSLDAVRIAFERNLLDQ